MSTYQGVLGVNKIDKGYQFSVWAPNAKSVSLVGDFNDWDEDQNTMQQADNGIWWVDIPTAANNDEYKFCIESADNKNNKKNDPRARKMTNSVGNSIIYDDDFNWKIDDFELPPVHQRIIYEMHIGTFNQLSGERGTFNSAIEKLDDLVELGVNVLEIMPVNEFAGDISWGYNPAAPFAIEEAYGGPDGLKQFIDAAHQRGMGVILDVVYNHLGPSDLNIWQFDGWSENDKGGIYFYNDQRSSTPWGETRPDYGRIEVRDYIKDNALMWLREFKADGLRVDMLPFMRCISGADNGQDDIPEAYELIQDINSTIKQHFPNKVCIAEDLHKHDFITDPVEQGGCGFTSQWDAEFVHPIRAALTQPTAEDIDLDKIVGALLHSYSGNIYSRVIYTESHDEVANGQARIVEEIAPGHVDDDFFARQKGIIAATLVLTTAGIPMLFQGQEMKESGWFDDNEALNWQKKEQFNEYYTAFQQLIALRKNSEGHSAGLTGDQTHIIHRDDAHKIIGFSRSNGVDDEQINVYLNLSDVEIEEYVLSELHEEATCLFAWSDGIVTEEVSVKNGSINIPKYSVFIFSN
ncbi:1,4-alpha-glucan branching protein [Psychromonas sp. B3M02]|uniref:alpha-amylase family glycosyl hydrolase n=1 Tax=Psychromonas sp. B3M02 TaxID=2267226 RepID=UPI000DEBB120|nr:alpha-amylase family glycosyl hydrolase [Psychromonas sp. B3M02]RBW43635.1 1,4-alpha-glucan branching protein [Psychromonas sp. B3M02]